MINDKSTLESELSGTSERKEIMSVSDDGVASHTRVLWNRTDELSICQQSRSAVHFTFEGTIRRQVSTLKRSVLLEGRTRKAGYPEAGKKPETKPQS